jgi:hypothetical protein
MLEDVGPQLRLRYHIWPEGWTVPKTQLDSEIHDHTFELNSAILLGSIRQEVFEFSPQQRGAYELVRVRYVADGSATLRRDGECGTLHLKETDTFIAGSAYRLPLATIHRAIAVKVPAVTLVLAVADATLTEPRIVIKRSSPPPADFPREGLTADEIKLAQEAIVSF